MSDENGLTTRAEELDALQPSEAYQQKWGEHVGLGRCPHCPKPWCWKSPNGWVCQLPKACLQPDTPTRTRAKPSPADTPKEAP
jgi:hypothetical protein